jgi:urocanate hydratase
MGGAQPLAITMNEGTCLAAEMEQWRIEKRIETKYLDKWTADLDEAINWSLDAKKNGEPISIAYCGNAVDLLQRLIDRNIVPDTLTDQTSAHDELIGIFPEGLSVEQAKILREQNPADYINRSLDTMARHVTQMLELQKRGAITFDYGNNLRGQAHDKRGVKNAFDFPGFVPAYIRHCFAREKDLSAG